MVEWMKDGAECTMRKVEGGGITGRLLMKKAHKS